MSFTFEPVIDRGIWYVSDSGFEDGNVFAIIEVCDDGMFFNMVDDDIQIDTDGIREIYEFMNGLTA